MNKYNAYIITGPTASGKSSFAHNLAKKINGVIINCDSVQTYRGIENISASPFAGMATDTNNIENIPYKLFSILDLSKQISVVEYIALAKQAYNQAMNDGQTPIFVGGTGYYINALINGISPIPDVSDASRKKARELVETDLPAARKLLPTDFAATDPQRTARALEVFFETGKHINYFQALPRTGAFLKNAHKTLIIPENTILHERIAERIPQMLAGGALTEAQKIIDSGWDESRAIGASQLCKLLRGEITHNEAVANWITKTNQYAKRQRTWFRTQFNPDEIIENI